MADIKLNSTYWCDFIFENKNKSYGAYRLRQSSSKRHVVAFLCTVGLAIAAVVIPVLVSEVQRLAAANSTKAIDQVLEMTQLDIEDQVPEENIIKQETAPPPPPVMTTVKFIPPVIGEDDEVADDIEVHTQEDLMQSTDRISIADVIGDDDELGIDIAELQEQKVIVEEKAKPIDFAEVMPTFPGGESEMLSWVSKNLVYPVMAQESGTSGRVVVRFVVSKTGKVEDAKVIRGIDSSCDREALRVVNAMPKWIPGKQNGETVAVYFNLPIVFRLQN